MWRFSQILLCKFGVRQGSVEQLQEVRWPVLSGDPVSLVSARPALIRSIFWQLHQVCCHLEAQLCFSAQGQQLAAVRGTQAWHVGMQVC